MAKLTSFQMDIRPLFTDRDIHAMSKRSISEVMTTSRRTLPPSMTAFGGSVVPSCRLRHREEKALGLNLGLRSSPDGCRTGTNPRKGR
jgi:hypothetical protein